MPIVVDRERCGDIEVLGLPVSVVNGSTRKPQRLTVFLPLEEIRLEASLVISESRRLLEAEYTWKCHDQGPGKESGDCGDRSQVVLAAVSSSSKKMIAAVLSPGRTRLHSGTLFHL